MCSATRPGTAGSWQTCETSAAASAGPARRKSTARVTRIVSRSAVETPRVTSAPRVVARDGTRHAARTAAAAHELAPLEGDDGALVVADLRLPREELDGGDDPEAHPLHLAEGVLV